MHDIITLRFIIYLLSLNYCPQIVSKNLSEPIRSHKDLDKDSAPLYHKAVKFYEGLSKQLVNQGHVLDLFACALDQVMLILLRKKLKNIYVLRFLLLHAILLPTRKIKGCHGMMTNNYVSYYLKDILRIK